MGACGLRIFMLPGLLLSRRGCTGACRRQERNIPLKQWHHIPVRTLTRLALGLALLVGLIGVTGGLSSKALAAADITVSTCNETSLDSALSSAVNGNTIDFSCSGTISLTSPLVISQSITLDGSGQHVDIDGGGNVQILQVGSGVNFTLNDLTISNGFSSLSGPTGTGGGLYNNGGSVTIDNSIFNGNTAAIAGGGLVNTGGGSVIINNSTFSNNSATSGGGGGIDNQNGRIIITNSEFTNNAANNNGGGGVFVLAGSVSIANSTFTGNMSTNGFGGAIYNLSTLNVVNSTIANNTAANAGGILNQGGNGSITNSTIVNNNLGGINDSSPNLSLSGDLLANNAGANCLTHGFTDNGYNLSSDTFCHLSGTGDQEGVDPLLDPKGLQFNGGYAQTIALQQGSPAIDAQGSGCPSTDERGVTRPDADVSETSCDIGAYESTFAAPDTTAPTLQLPSTITVSATSQQGAYVSYTVTATDPDNPASQLTISCSPVSGSQFPIGNSTVNCSASDPAGNSTTGSFSVIVQPSITVSVANVSAREGHTFNLVVATGAAYGTTGTLTATINWGDSSSSAGNVTVTSSGLFSVVGKHAYAEEGSYPVTVSVSDGGGHTGQANGTATIGDAVLKVNTPAVSVNGLNVTLNGTFTDSDPGGTVSDYTATISWGDGTTTSGTVGSASGFTVSGSHTYAKHKTFTVKITVTDAGGSSSTVTVKVTV